jgi:CheY-like chemotaxis protein
MEDPMIFTTNRGWRAARSDLRPHKVTQSGHLRTPSLSFDPRNAARTLCASPCVLVADDDEAVRSVVTELLHRCGMEARCARDGGEALELLHTGGLPDLLLLDLAMPRVDGWRVLDAMAREDRLRALPTVVLTSFGSCEDLPENVPTIHKPVDPDLLLHVIRVELGLLD